MALISPTLLLRTLSIFHLTSAYYLLVTPLKLADQNLVFILGASMSLPEAPPSLSIKSPALALAAMFLALLAIGDLTATNLDEEVGSYYWSSQAPVRLIFFFGVTGYSYLGKPEEGKVLDVGEGTALSGLVCNSLVFTWGFVEMLAWFWVSSELISIFEGREANVHIDICEVKGRKKGDFGKERGEKKG